MIYMSFSDELIKLLFCLLAGCVLGFAYDSVTLVFCIIKNIVMMPKNIVQLSLSPSFSKAGERISELKIKPSGALGIFFRDFIFLIFGCVFFNIFIYAFYDGVIRVLSVIVIVAVFFIYRKTFGRAATFGAKYLFEKLSVTVMALAAFLLCPVSRTIKKIAMLISMLLSRTARYIDIILYRMRIEGKKMGEMDELISNLLKNKQKT